MKGIIIYQGKYGATDQYAKWLAATLTLPLIEAKNIDSSKLVGYDVVILGSSVYVGKLVITRWLTSYLPVLIQKKLLFFVVSGTSAHDPSQQGIITENLPSKVRDTARLFFLPGRCIISQLSWKDRIILKMGAWLEKDPQKKAVMESGFDEMNERALAPLITVARTLLHHRNSD